MWTRAELKNNAKEFFKYNYWKMVLAALVLSFVGGGGGGVSAGYTRANTDDAGGFNFSGMSPAELGALAVGVLVAVIVVCVVIGALQWFVFNPLIVGAQRFFVVSHYRKAELGELGFAFSRSYLNIVKVMFLRQLYTFLWTLLFIIPGIIKAYEYLMIPYILAENPDIDAKEAFAMSKQMMTGNKWNAFVLELSFFGWMLLSACTCNILAIFWVNPYMYMTLAELYVALKEITYGGGQNPYAQSGGQWNGGGQWNNANPQSGQWNSGSGQWSNPDPQGGQWNNNNPNQWNGGSAQQPNDSGQWNQPNNGNWN